MPFGNCSRPPRDKITQLGRCGSGNGAELREIEEKDAPHKKWRSKESSQPKNGRTKHSNSRNLIWRRKVLVKGQEVGILDSHVEQQDNFKITKKPNKLDKSAHEKKERRKNNYRGKGSRNKRAIRRHIARKAMWEYISAQLSTNPWAVKSAKEGSRMVIEATEAETLAIGLKRIMNVLYEWNWIRSPDIDIYSESFMKESWWWRPWCEGCLRKANKIERREKYYHGARVLAVQGHGRQAKKLVETPTTGEEWRWEARRQAIRQQAWRIGAESWRQRRNMQRLLSQAGWEEKDIEMWMTLEENAERVPLKDTRIRRKDRRRWHKTQEREREMGMRQLNDSRSLLKSDKERWIESLEMMLQRVQTLPVNRPAPGEHSWTFPEQVAEVSVLDDVEEWETEEDEGTHRRGDSDGLFSGGYEEEEEQWNGAKDYKRAASRQAQITEYWKNRKVKDKIIEGQGNAEGAKKGQENQQLFGGLKRGFLL